MSSSQTDFHWLRWLNVALRGLHLVSVIVMGAALLGAPVASTPAVVGAAITGFTMFALDLWQKPGHLRETSGVAVLVKLALLLWMVFDAGSRAILFWLIVAGSAIFAHAPASFRHAVLLHKGSI